jgi:hypothetical protein|tara:strand:- start:864 stop:1124 length:261 start_codon:yes stop_codon:yes gene_type:complete
MNFFAIQPNLIKELATRVQEFKEQNKEDRKKECYIHLELINILKEQNKKMKALPIQETWLGLTNPEDEITVREKLKTNITFKYYIQ